MFPSESFHSSHTNLSSSFSLIFSTHVFSTCKENVKNKKKKMKKSMLLREFSDMFGVLVEHQKYFFSGGA